MSIILFLRESIDGNADDAESDRIKMIFFFHI